MPTFDIVSEINQHELANAIDQSNREIANRFDFKDTKANFELEKQQIILSAENEFQIKQMYEILINKLVKRQIDIKCLEPLKIETNLNAAKQTVKLKQGIDKENAKKINKLIKDSQLKIQSTIQEDQIRVTGKKRDDLQLVISLLKNNPIEIPLQFLNFRD